MCFVFSEHAKSVLTSCCMTNDSEIKSDSRFLHRDPKKTGPPNTLSYNAIISQYCFNKFYEMFEEVKDCKQ